MFSLSWKILHIVAFLIGNASLRGVGIECWPWSPDLVSCVGWVCFWSLSLLQVYCGEKFLPGHSWKWKGLLKFNHYIYQLEKGFDLVIIFQCILLSLHSQSCQNNGQQSVTSRTPYFRYHHEFLFFLFYFSSKFFF